MSEPEEDGGGKTLAIDKLPEDLEETESLFSTNTMMELTPNERYFESCSTCEDIDKPSPSFQEMMKNLHLHDK